MEVAIMIEGQNGLTWERWQRLVTAVEEFGYVGLYRSDHYTNANPPDKESLELWVSLTWLAANTELIDFGPLVSPVSFRHPTMTARMAAALDDLSFGRLTLGLGAGWQEREHTNFGWDLLPIPERFDRFEEGLEVITRLLHQDHPVNFSGEYYSLHDAILLPRPQRPHGPPILIGGNGPQRTLPLVARYADVWNAVFVPPARFAELNAQLDELLEENGRTPDDVGRTLMTGCVFGRNGAEIRAKVSEYKDQTAASLRKRGIVVGTGSEIVDQLGHLEEAGVERVMLQWLALDDISGLEAMANAIL